MFALLGEASVINYQRFDTRQLVLKDPRKTSEDLALGPRGDRHGLLKALPHPLDFSGVINQPTSHRLDAFSISFEEKPGDVRDQIRSSLDATESADDRLDELFELTLEAFQLLLVHSP